MARRKKRFAGLPSEHAQLAESFYKEVSTKANTALKQAKDGYCHEAAKSLVRAHEQYGRATANVRHARGLTGSVSKSGETAREHLEEAHERVFRSCIRSRAD